MSRFCKDDLVYVLDTDFSTGFYKCVEAVIVDKMISDGWIITTDDEYDVECPNCVIYGFEDVAENRAIELSLGASMTDEEKEWFGEDKEEEFEKGYNRWFGEFLKRSMTPDPEDNTSLCEEEEYDIEQDRWLEDWREVCKKLYNKEE